MKHNGYNLHLSKGKYPNGQNSIKLIIDDESSEENGFPYATASIAITEHLKPNEIAIKDYSENEGILDMLVDNNIVSQPIRFVHSGYVAIPICNLI